jgi:hypothetical protein
VLGIIPKKTNSSKEVAPVWEHRTVRCALESVWCLGWPSVNRPLSGSDWGHCGYKSPDCPVCIRLSGVPAARLTNGRPRNQRRPRQISQRSSSHTGMTGAQRTVRCAKWPKGGNGRIQRATNVAGTGQ